MPRLHPRTLPRRSGRSSHREGVTYQDHWFAAPLDYTNDSDAQTTIEVYARSVTADGAESYPWLIYFQGGPGGRADRPATVSGWLKEALKHFQVLLLDQRGTGLSTPATAQTLPLIGNPSEQADYLSFFRADSIVADAESIRLSFIRDGFLDGPWSTLGQSYGGFCTLTYLSFYPEGLRESLITAGLGPLSGSARRVYTHAFARVAARNKEFFERFPWARARTNAIAQHLRTVDERLPTGERLTVERFQMLGAYLGGNTRIDALSYLLEDAFPLVSGRLPEAFLAQVSGVVSFSTNPLYAVLHEAIYAQGEASDWAASHVAEQRPEFSPDAPDLLFTGEAIMPWYFEQDPALVPLNEVAQRLAQRVDWPELYNLAQLAKNAVPVAATAYLDDIYVDHTLAVETARQVNNLRLWETDAYHHDGLRADGEKIFATLLDMARRPS